MFLGDFQPFPANCGSLSVSQNSLASAVFEYIENDADIYTKQRRPIELNLLERIKDGSFDDIKASKAFENLVVSHKKYIVESLNKIKMFVHTHGKLTTLKINKTMKRHIACLLVNNFLQQYEHEIKQLTDEGEPEPEEEEDEEDDDEELCEYCDHNENECECKCDNCDQKGDNCVCNLDLVDEVIGLREELKQAYKNKMAVCFHCDKNKESCNCFLFLNKNEKEIIIEKDEITFSWCGRCHNTLKTCICYSDLVVELDKKIENIKEERDYNFIKIGKMANDYAEKIKEVEEELEGAKEIIKGHQPIEKVCNDEINKLNNELGAVYSELNSKIEQIDKLREQNKELELKSQSDYQTYKNMGRHIDNLNEDIRLLKLEKTQNKKENTRLKNKLEETENFRQQNSKAVKETVDETYKLNGQIEKLKKELEEEVKNRCKIMEVFKKVCDEKANEQMELIKLKAQMNL